MEIAGEGPCRCIHVVASLHPDGGGPSRTVVHLTDALATRGDVSVSLVTQGLDGEPAVASSSSSVDRHFCVARSRASLILGEPVRKELAALCQVAPPSIFHSHGVWLPVNHWASQAAVKRGIPLVIHPRGMLEPWALQHKSFKKHLAMALFQGRDLSAASAFIATSVSEMESIRALGLKQPVAVIPNGVAELQSEEYRLDDPVVKQERIALFLSRVHEKKGLLNLIKAWGILRPEGWRLQIAGPDEGGHLSAVMAEVRSQGISEHVEYLGAVDGDRKSQTYRAADIFVLPTFSENFGVVVAEALAQGIPVITTRGTPWSDLESYRCGWWIDIGVEPLVSALRESMSLSDPARRAMGERGRDYVRRYNWDAIAKSTSDVYRWLLGREKAPDCVHLI